MDFIPQKYIKAWLLSQRWNENSTKIDDSCRICSSFRRYA